jgi:hypothetical protein
MQAIELSGLYTSRHKLLKFSTLIIDMPSYELWEATAGGIDFRPLLEPLEPLSPIPAMSLRENVSVQQSDVAKLR